MKTPSFVMGLLQVFFGCLLIIHRFQMGRGFEGFWPFMIGWAVVWAAVVFVWEGVKNVRDSLKF